MPLAPPVTNRTWFSKRITPLCDMRRGDTNNVVS